MEKLIYEGRIFSVIEKPSFNGLGLRDIVVHPGAAGAVVLKSRKKVILTKQFREATGEHILEIPAGLLSKNESAEQCIIRELKEEIGASGGKLSFMRWFYTTPGFTNERFYLYLVEDPELGKNELDDDEVIESVEVTVEDAFKMLADGTITDAKTVIALLELEKLLRADS
jgi:ADP-ribose pyrophosphatase